MAVTKYKERVGHKQSDTDVNDNDIVKDPGIKSLIEENVRPDTDINVIVVVLRIELIDSTDGVIRKICVIMHQVVKFDGNCFLQIETRQSAVICKRRGSGASKYIPNRHISIDDRISS